MCDNALHPSDTSRLILESCKIISNIHLKTGMSLITLEVPKIAANIKAGQFVHLRVSDKTSRMILRRPLSVCAYDKKQGTITIYYQVKGIGTATLANKEKGETLDCVGPIGRPWAAPSHCSKALLVGGGVGCAPLTPLYKELLGAGVDVQMIRGAQNAAVMDDLSVLDFANDGHEMIFTTDDGSVGYHGFVTVPARECLDSGAYDYVATCGPEPMQKLIAAMAGEAGVYCEVSLERRMACGIGACLSCVVDTTDGKKRACIDGPVFDASVIVW
jgi:dihydroorotate dehydrogenase electron transfer subunit